MLKNILSPGECDTLSSLIDSSDNIVVCCHVNPDGDALGSCLGWAEFLRSRGKEPQIIIPDQYPDFLQWMPKTEMVIRYDKHKVEADELISCADLVFCLDFNQLSRTDAMAASLTDSHAPKVMFDHHLGPDIDCVLCVSRPEMSSTSEMVFRIVWQMDGFKMMTSRFAAPIYCGMMTDTGGFTYNSNNREIYFIISELLSKGIDKDDIYRKVYNTYSESRLRLMGYVLSNMTVYSDYNAALITLTKAEQSKFNYIKGDSEGFVNIPLTIKNVCFSCFLREDTEKPMIKISLRSVGTFPCNQLAAEFFHGGGHLNASGGEYFGTMEEAKAVFEKALEKYKPLLTAKS